MVESFMFERAEHRFHRQVWQMTSFLAICFEAELKPRAPGAAFNAVLIGNTIPFDITISMSGVYEMYRSIKIGGYVHWGPHPKTNSGKRASYFDLQRSELTHTVFAGLFAIAVEPYLDWIKREIGTDYPNWPPVAAFCRLARNAIAHSGIVSLNSEAAASASWRGATISHAINGRLIGEHVTSGDFIVLLHDFDKELASLGAPLSLTWQVLEPSDEFPGVLIVPMPPPERSADRGTPDMPRSVVDV